MLASSLDVVFNPCHIGRLVDTFEPVEVLVEPGVDMDARAKSVREILHSGDQYLVPFFQRSYSWTKPNWQRLADDLETLLNDTRRVQHFLGPLVCTPGEHVPGEVSPYQLIDGQQRLTTLTILLAALRDAATGRGDADLAGEIEEDLLVHKRKPGLQRFKLVPRLGDREIYSALINRKELEGNAIATSPILAGYKFFAKWIDKLLNSRPDVLRSVVATVADRLSLVMITITAENPYEIYDSLNTAGVKLEESDLVRNYMFMQIPLDHQTDFHAEHWGPFESLLLEKVSGRSLDPTDFYRDYVMREGVYSKKKSTFVDFKEQNRRRSLEPTTQVIELKKFAKVARQIEGIDSAPAPISRLLENLREIEASTARPLLMSLFARWQGGSITIEELGGCLTDLASFVLRRSVCGLSTRGYGQWFTDAISKIGQSARTDLQSFLSAKGWPPDAIFIDKLIQFDLYKREPGKTRLILNRLEDSYGHKERVDRSVLTIEHVLAQKLSDPAVAEFSATIGPGGNWYPIHQKWVHTLGNLTLTGYNSELSNRPYAAKRPDLLESNLLLNDYFRGMSVWGPIEIERRGRVLATEVCGLWPNPKPSEGDEDVDAGRTAAVGFDIAGLRQAAAKTLSTALKIQLTGEAEARFTGPEIKLVCLASRPYAQGQSTNYWFGVSPSQLEFLAGAGRRYVALSCGSPDRILLFTRDQFEPLTHSLSVTEHDVLQEGDNSTHEIHWHVAVSWAGRVLIDLPKAGEKLDVTERVFTGEKFSAQFANADY